MTKSLIERGIRVKAVAPRKIWTPLIPASFSADLNALHGSSLYQRIGQPFELAPTYVTLHLMIHDLLLAKFYMLMQENRYTPNSDTKTSLKTEANFNLGKKFFEKFFCLNFLLHIFLTSFSYIY
nr:hypothetical protein [Virgibacillus pantothenticus]